VDPLSKVRPGQAVVFTAAGHNAVVDAAKAHEQHRLGSAGQPARSIRLSPGEILVRNDSGSDVARFGILSLGNSVIAPGTSYDGFAEQVCLSSHAISPLRPNWCVTQEPIPAGAIGRAVVSGATVARVLVQPGQEQLRYAEPLTNLYLQCVESGQAEILYRETGTGPRNAVVRMSNTPSTGQGVVFLAIVVAPTTNGSNGSVFTVDVFGTTIASLSEAPTLEGVAATQVGTTDRYWLGELVGVARSGNTWLITKFMTLPVAYTVSAQQVVLRLARPVANDATRATNFLMDLHSCLAFYDGGNQASEAYVSFNFGALAGWGRVSKLAVVPIPFRASEGWTLCQPIVFSTSDDTVYAALATGSFSAMTNSQDTNATSFVEAPSLGIGTSWTATTTHGIGTYVISQGGGLFAYVTQIVFSLVVRVDFLATDNALLTGVFGSVTLPSIPGAVDSARLLCAYFQISISIASQTMTAGPATQSNPTAVSVVSVPAGGRSYAGSYTVNTPVVFNTVTVS